ncbi:hypothetical protein E0Z10_g6297 [Xylaria hypoxylon]|uniref:Uncharacterized protein n=1 Tax=Xylaria hypoxylon TaxID=37992 RepID=A0A4Z0YYN9_9PEZI|nr:hypothetical protein E0Z10_g6297 [Xylaria hypoxylon]
MDSKGVGRRAAAKAPVTHVPDEPLHGGPETVSDKTLRAPSYNGFVTPVNASKNAHQYVSRPLPATPPSRAKMVDRPSTSGGPGSKKTAKPDFNFDKRVSRDDFYLGSRGYEETRSGPLNPFRGQPPTPDSSPKAASAQRFASRTNKWEPTTDPVRGTGDAGIGMALGSPTHAPNFSDPWNMQNAARTRKDSHPIVTPPLSRGSSVDTFDMPISRKPSGKWKLFSIFARKQTDQPVPAVSISDPNGLYGTNRPEEEAVVASQALSSDSKNPARSNTTTSTRKAPRHKPIVVRSQTMPLNVQVDKYDRKPRSGEKQGDGKFGRIPIALDSSPTSGPVVKPLLDVQIPDVRLERYSVMFDGVLKSNPSLLSRRQATMPKLKSIDDVVEEEHKPYGVIRRATSPQPQQAARSSGLALFPTSKQSHNLMPQKLSPRLRSNTSPALLPSPSRATFDRTTPSYSRPSVEGASSLKHPRHIFHRHDEKHGIAVTVQSDTMERETSSLPRQFNNEQSNLILDSPTEIQSVDDEVITSQTWKPVAYQIPPEPKWQMISPSQKTPSTASSYTSSYRKRSPSLASTHVTRPSEDSDDASYINGTSNGSAKMTPVEISIARQISMSREQRKLLQPLRTGPSPPVSSGRRPSRASPARASPVTGVAVGDSGRIAETKTSTPTLIHPPGMLDSQLTIAQHRRSEWVVLEDA